MIHYRASVQLGIACGQQKSRPTGNVKTAQGCLSINGIEVGASKNLQHYLQLTQMRLRKLDAECNQNRGHHICTAVQAAVTCPGQVVQKTNLSLDHGIQIGFDNLHRLRTELNSLMCLVKYTYTAKEGDNQSHLTCVRECFSNKFRMRSLRSSRLGEG